VDILEKLFLKIIENSKDNVFKIDSDMINLIGCSKENFFKLLELMQYKPKKVENGKKEFFIYKPSTTKNKRCAILRYQESTTNLAGLCCFGILIRLLVGKVGNWR